MTNKILVGAHTSAAGGAPNALLEGADIGATTIQLFTSNQKQWNGRQITKEEIELWKKVRGETGIQDVMSHDSYLINLGSESEEGLVKSRAAFLQEIKRCHALEIPYLNFHPGTAGKATEDECIERIIQSLLGLEKIVSEGNTRLLLETTAGQGTSVGHKFEHIAAIINGVHQKIPIGVCIDTCHIFAAGYDIRTAQGCEKTLEEFERVVGLKHLYAFHLNDSVKPLGSRVDRHAGLGAGEIGLACFEWLMNDPRVKWLPKYLETPVGLEGWKKEIALLKTFAESHV